MTYVIVGLLVVVLILEIVLLVSVSILIEGLSGHEEAVAKNFHDLGLAIGGILSQLGDHHGEHRSTLESHGKRISELVTEIGKHPKAAQHGGLR